MSSVINGLFFEAGNSAQQNVSLSYDDFGEIHIQGTSYLANKVEISPRVGNTVRYIDFPDGSQFESNENDAIDTLQDRIKPSKLTHLVYKLEKARIFVVTSLLILVIGGWAFIQFGVPYLSRELAMKLPEDTLHHLGQGMLNALDEDIFEASKISVERQEDLSRLFHDLSDGIGKNKSKIQFRDGGFIGANALALPNGVVVVTDQLLELVSEDEEIISIMLHELGHVENRHILRSLIQSFSMTFFVMAVTGDVSTASNMLASAPLLFIQAGYSQEMELEADSFSLDYMLTNKIDPMNFVVIMSKLEASNTAKFRNCKSQGDKDIQSCLTSAMEELDDAKTKRYSFGNYLSTHPSLEERIKSFENPRR